MDEHYTVLVAGFDSECGKHILASFHNDESIQIVGILENPAEAVQYAISTPPDLVVVCGKNHAAWLEICTFVGLALPQTRVILVVQQIDLEILSNAMMLGVRQVLTYDNLEETILPTIMRIQQLDEVETSAEYITATDPLKHPRIISLSGAKGGVGKTTLTVNLGVALAQLDAGPVVIWDAYKQFGDIANVMGITSCRTLSELIDIDDIDEDLILSCIVNHDSGAHVLITSDRPVSTDAMNEAMFERIITALRRHYRFIVVDTPPLLSPSDTLIFSRSWKILLVTNLKDVAAISDALKMIDMLEPHFVRGEVISVILNRTSRSDSVKDTEVEKIIGKQVIATIPEDPQVVLANNLGRPICQTDPRNRTVKAIKQLADLIAHTASVFRKC